MPVSLGVLTRLHVHPSHSGSTKALLGGSMLRPRMQLIAGVTAYDTVREMTAADSMALKALVDPK